MKIEIQEGFPNVEVIIKCPSATEDIRRMESLLYGGSQRLSCIKDGMTHLVDRNDVQYMESVDRHCFIYTTTNVYETLLKLYELEQLLTEAGFIRSAKAQILNIKKIASLCPDFGGRIEAVMENGEKLIVSRQYVRSLKGRLGLK